MRKICSTIFLLTAVITLYGQNGQSAGSNKEISKQELWQLRQAFFDAQTQGNRLVLEKLLADSFYFVHSTGVVEKKTSFIDRTVAQTNIRSEIKFLEDQLYVYNNTTVVWFTRSVRRNPDGTEISFRATDVLVKNDTQWQWVSVHSTRLASRPKPYTMALEVLKSFIGEYEINTNRTLTIKEDTSGLIGQLAGVRQQELIPVSNTEFVWFSPESNVDMRISFAYDSTGKITHAILHSEGKEIWRAKKMN